MSNFNQYGEHQILLKFAQNYMNDKIKFGEFQILGPNLPKKM